MTWLIVGTSMPRAATSVATSILQLARRAGPAARGCAGPADAAVQRSDGMAHVGQAVGQPVGIALGAGEDERLLHLALGQDVVEQRVLVRAVVGPVQALLDVGVGVGVRRDVDVLRVAQQVLRQAADVADEGRAVHHGLARRRHVVGDGADVVDEAHVEHAVGFVEDEHLDVVEHRPCRSAGGRAGGPGVEIRMSSGPRSAFDLRRIRHAADDGRDAQALHVAAVGAGRLGDLHRELAGRRQHQHARAVDHALVAPLASVSARAARMRCSAGRMKDAVLPLPVLGRRPSGRRRRAPAGSPRLARWSAAS